MHPFLPENKRFYFGGLQVELQVPDSDVLRTQLTAGEGAVPYWAKLWPAAVALSGFIAANAALVAGKRILELAAGLGLPGMVAAHFAATVTISDYAEEAVQLMRETVALNGLNNTRCQLLDWEALPDEAFETDMLLLSDVNYDPATFAMLHEVLCRFLRGGTTIVLSTPQRLPGKPFIEQLMRWRCLQEERFVDGVWVSLLVLRGGDSC